MAVPLDNIRDGAAIFLYRLRRPVPISILVKCQSQNACDAPADWPCTPDAGGAECALREDECQYNAQNQVGEGADHKLRHCSGAAQNAVAHEFDGYDKVKR